jgi:hypothetical protein
MAEASRRVLRACRHPRRYELNQPPWHYLDNGSLQFELSNHDNTNVARWSLRNHGIVLAGTPVSEVVDEVTSEMLTNEIGAVIPDWGDEKYCWLALAYDGNH